MITLGIETTCDETGCGIVRNGTEILANVVTSQIDLHEEYGGVVPELACRRHVDLIIPVIDQALSEAKVNFQAIDLIAVARGPGLIGALLIGINAAKALAWTLKKPIVGVNHIEAHLYAALMSHAHPPQFPALGAVISGGHTSLIYMKDIGSYEQIGHTVDDAIGEAFDKAAKILGLPYPGGPAIEQLAKGGDPYRFPLKAGRVKSNPYDFSFSGLKTGVLYTAKGQSSSIHDTYVIDEQGKKDLAASFQRVAFVDLIKKTLSAAEKYGCKSIVFGGGVTCNERLKEMFAEAHSGMTYYWPARGLSLDNAAMIAGLGYHKFIKNGPDTLDIEALTRISF
jgi:N6-L-threonylcarbamoyladenine synthase